MKKWYLIGVALLVVTSISVYSANRFPKLNGNQIKFVLVMDINGKVVTDWSLLKDKQTKDNKEKIETVIKAFESGELVDKNSNQPNYWVHMGVKNGSDRDYLVWLEDKKQASYLSGSLSRLQFGLGEQSAYRIEDETRDNILKLLVK